MAAKRILLVEDEVNLLNTIKLNLEMEGFEVDGISNGAEVIKQFKTKSYSLVILDVMLPEVDGFTLCETIRHHDAKVPVLFLTAKGSSEDRVKGLKLGADDYLVKPFILEELLLRVNNLVKRSAIGSEKRELSEYRFGKNYVNFITYEIKDQSGKKHELSKRDVQLLKMLIEKKNQVVSRENILENIWGQDAYPTSRTIDNYILVFRKYFEKDPKNPVFFHSIRGVGYKFTA